MRNLRNDIEMVFGKEQEFQISDLDYCLGGSGEDFSTVINFCHGGGNWSKLESLIILYDPSKMRMKGTWTSTYHPYVGNLEK